MKFLLILTFLLGSIPTQSQPIFSKKGHPEHIIAGTLIGAGISYYVFTKTQNKVKSWIIAAVSTSLIAYVKEAVDPKWFGGVRSSKDFMFSALGSVVGASMVIPLNRRPKSQKLTSFQKVF
ncbi:hypothetical protein MWU59_01925 [Flavobacteriaceae bacterium F08102]|nr:hypothetical protein [Flavobacteriaceae bacterium F08102]